VVNETCLERKQEVTGLYQAVQDGSLPNRRRRRR
jgi:hypothetical protein